MRCPWLAWFVAVAQLVAQDTPGWNEGLRQRAEAGQDLIELRYRRCDHGRLEVASCEHGAIPFGPMFPENVLPRPTRLRDVGLASMFWLTQGEAGALACTDGERHLRRAGVDPSPVALRQDPLTAIPAGDAALARVETLDRLVAIDTLLRAGQRGVIAELTALSKDPGTPPLLAARARNALATLGKQPTAIVRRRLSPATLLLPVAADAYVAIDHAQLPAPTTLRALARRMAIDFSHRVLEALRAPTPDDLFHGQFLADATEELPFEIVRRFGECRFDHSVLAIQAMANGSQPFGWNLQAAGELEFAQVVAAVEQFAALPEAKTKCSRRDDTLHADTELVAFDFTPSAFGMHSKGMGGRPRPELAAELLADGPAVRVLIPPQSKLWLALAFLELPPALRAELTLSFGDTLRACLTIAARDEDAAAAWAERGKQLLAAWSDEVRALAGRGPAPAADVQPLLDAIAATTISTEGARVQALLTSRTVGAPVLFALAAAWLRTPR